MNDIFDRRRAHTDRVLETLIDSLRATLGDAYEKVIGDHTFVYATGSCGRGEMGAGSDLDAYVVRAGTPPHDCGALLQDAVRAANDEAKLPPLDGGGRYIDTVQAHELIDRLGAPEDDTREEGVFTKRMLLLLESRVMLGEQAYARVIDAVIDAYWQNAELQLSNYQPFVLVNDIVRWWRIVLLNHESKLRNSERKLADDPNVSTEDATALLLAQRRYRSYKMRLARCLTCFSALTYLLALVPSDASHVSQAQVREMVKLRPLERISMLQALVGRELPAVPELLATYASYLERTRVGKQALLRQLHDDRDTARDISREGGRFTRLMFELVQDLGGGRRLHRHMLV